jgi:hypothetical protein
MENYTKNLRGQGAAEYLILLAVVLIVAMVAVVLLGFFPGMAGDAQISSSQSYWSSTKPISILQWGQTSTSNLFLKVQNNGERQIQINSINISGTGASGSFVPTGNEGYLSVGGQLVAEVLIDQNCTPGNNYEYDVNVSYMTPGGLSIQRKQVGEKTIIGKCGGS